MDDREHRPRSVGAVVEKYGAAMETRLRPIATGAGDVWPPESLTLIGYKEERRLDVWATGRKTYPLVRYAVLGTSGGTGPKRREGDLQVPEGIYRLTALNPLSRFHLSIRLDYPNADDIRNLGAPRDELGGDIYIHGSSVSVGCLAIGDRAIEELFSLVATVGLRDCEALLVPWDLASRALPKTSEDWLAGRYRRLAARLRQLDPNRWTDRAKRTPME
jgi:hypothetical protein